jgi:6-phosphofructokinase 1
VNFLKRIGVVTSGGDAPGMNAVIRAIVRRAIPLGMKVIGFENGYSGLIADEEKPLNLRSVSGIINLGGTFLGSRRCPEFKTEKGLKKALENLNRHKITDFIVIGGEGSLNGALDLSRFDSINVYGIPCSIDNDVYGTDETVGFDTAVNTALSAIDRIRDTATSHRRVFIVEVMGRKRGFLALSVGLAAGAEKILVPEVKVDLEKVLELLENNRKKGKKSNIIVAAEGVGDLRMITKRIHKRTGYEVRLSILGHIQRGGSPTARSRILANLFGSEVVKMVESENGNRIVGLLNGKVTSTSLEEACKKKKPLDLDLLRLTEQLAT